MAESRLTIVADEKGANYDFDGSAEHFEAMLIGTRQTLGAFIDTITEEDVELALRKSCVIIIEDRDDEMVNVSVEGEATMLDALLHIAFLASQDNE